MAAHKDPHLKVDDIITIVGAMAGVVVNQPEQQFLIKLAITQAQQEICDHWRWTWLRSSGVYAYSANASTFNMYSVSSGKYTAFGSFETMRVPRVKEVIEGKVSTYNRTHLYISTATYPDYYVPFGEATFRWLPVPNTAGSVAFTFLKRPGFVHGNNDLIIPQKYIMTALVPLSRKRLWELKGDPRSGQGDSSYANALRAMKRDEGNKHEWGAWHPNRRASYDPDWQYSGFYSSGNMP